MPNHTNLIRVVVGRIGRPHGIRGEITIEVRTDEPDVRFADGAKLFIADDASERVLEVEKTRWQSGKLVVKFAGYPDRSTVETLRGILLEAEVNPDTLPTDSDEYYDRQLIGLTARVADSEIGRVSDVLHLPGQDALVVQLSNREVIVPFVNQIVPTVSISEGFVDITPPPGLFDDQAEVVQDEN